jgi:hypothetical protein
MPTPQYKFDFAPRATLRLNEIQEIVKHYRLMGNEKPSRDMLIRMCEDGTFDATKTRVGWLVFEDSFDSWVSSLQQRRAA